MDDLFRQSDVSAASEFSQWCFVCFCFFLFIVFFFFHPPAQLNRENVLNSLVFFSSSSSFPRR